MCTQGNRKACKDFDARQVRNGGILNPGYHRLRRLRPLGQRSLAETTDFPELPEPFSQCPLDPSRPGAVIPGMRLEYLFQLVFVLIPEYPSVIKRIFPISGAESWLTSPLPEGSCIAISIYCLGPTFREVG
jgi:hypothetical protein